MSAYNKKSLKESGRHSHGNYTLKLYMYSDNPLYFDGMCIICTEVVHGESCSENIQYEGLVEAQCVSNQCQCTSSFYDNGRRCVGNIGIYRVYISKIIYNAIFSATIFILASLIERKNCCTLFPSTQKIREIFDSRLSESETAICS